MESKVRLELLLQSANDALAADKKDTPQQHYCPTAQKVMLLATASLCILMSQVVFIS